MGLTAPFAWARNRAQRLAAERDKASHALREWAGAEGPDLNVSLSPRPLRWPEDELTSPGGSQDVVSKVCTLYDYLSKAEMAYAEHNGNYRCVPITTPALRNYGDEADPYTPPLAASGSKRFGARKRRSPDSKSRGIRSGAGSRRRIARCPR